MIPRTIPGKPAPEPKSVHVLMSFLSIKSIVCILSAICLDFIELSVLLLIKFISLFFKIMSFEYSSNLSSVSRETSRLNFGTVFKKYESIKLYA